MNGLKKVLVGAFAMSAMPFAVAAENDVETLVCHVGAPLSSVAHTYEETGPGVGTLLAVPAAAFGALNGWVAQPVEAITDGDKLDCSDASVTLG